MSLLNEERVSPSQSQHHVVWISETAIGKVAIVELQGRMTHLFLPGETIPSEVVCHMTVRLLEAFHQLEEYLSGHRQRFALSLAPEGTPFMRQVWSCVSMVPYGCTASYGQIAHQMGKPGATRAVGMATHKNPLPIFIPCHRIIGAGGSLTGYRGGLALKTRLLELERP